MKRIFLATLTICILSLVAFLPVHSAQAPAAQPFSADFTSTFTSTKGTTVITGKIYSSPPMLRHESSINGRESTINIYSDGRVRYVIWPAQHAYREVQLDQESPADRAILELKMYDPEQPCGPDITACTRAGTEMVDGRLCEKWVHVTDKLTATTWFDRKIAFPIKRSETTGFVMRLTNITEEKPDPSLFIVPAGYHNAAELGGVIAGTPGRSH